MSLLYLRHGETSLNGIPGGSEERLRGWLPVSLTPKGIQQAKDAGTAIKNIPFHTFHTSDLPRALETAKHVSKVTGLTSTPTGALRDWNTGDLAGQKFTDVKDHLFHLIDHPDEDPPNGEPLNYYLERFVPFAKKLVESPDTHLAIGHARGTQVLRALGANNGDFLSSQPLKDKPITDPGQSLIISPDWSMLPDK